MRIASLAVACVTGLAACSASRDTPTEPGPNNDDGSGHLGDLDEPCELDDSRFAGVEIDRELPTGGTARVSWSAPGSSGTWLRYLDSLGATQQLALDPDGGVTVRGVLPNSPVDLVLVSRDDEGLWCSSVRSVTASPLPAGLPELTLDLADGAVASRWFAMPILTPDRRFAGVVDTGGNLVWAWELPDDVSPDSAVYRAAFSRDGEGLLINTKSAPGQPGAIWRVPWSGVGVETTLLDNIHRDFVELPDGTLAFLAWESRELSNGALLRGDIILELSPGGELSVAWNMWEDYDHGLGETTPLEAIDVPGVQEWAHANGLAWDADTDAWLISLPDLGPRDTPEPPGSLLSVDRLTGSTNWELSHTRGDFVLQGEQWALEAPHSIQLVEGGVLTFNRGSVESCSRATEISLDSPGGTAEVVWDSQSDDCVRVVFLGEAHRLQDGTTVVMYSSAGQLDIVDEQGRALWSLRADLGAGFGFVDDRETLHGAEDAL